MAKNKHLSIKADEKLIEKINYISKHSNISINDNVNSLIKTFIDEFENKYGEIEVPKHLQKK